MCKNSWSWRFLIQNIYKKRLTSANMSTCCKMTFSGKITVKINSIILWRSQVFWGGLCGVHRSVDVPILYVMCLCLSPRGLMGRGRGLCLLVSWRAFSVIQSCVGNRWINNFHCLRLSRSFILPHWWPRFEHVRGRRMRCLLISHVAPTVTAGRFRRVCEATRVLAERPGCVVPACWSAFPPASNHGGWLQVLLGGRGPGSAFHSPRHATPARPTTTWQIRRTQATPATEVQPVRCREGG